MPQFKTAFEELVREKPSEQSAVPDSLKDLPLVVVPAGDSTRDVMGVHLTGDGGWGVTDKGLSASLAEQGVPVVGLNCLKYFWSKKTPDQAAGDLARVLRHYMQAWHKERAILIGYSFGADVLPFLANRLPADLSGNVPLVALLGPSPNADFDFHLTDWLGSHRRKDSYPVLPEVQRMTTPRILCFYGESDKDAICKELDPSRVTSIEMSGGHRVGKKFEGIAQDILHALP